MIILISCLLLIIFSYLFFIILRNKINDSYKHIISLSIRLIGTFVGVLLALYVKDLSTEYSEKKELDSLYQSAIRDLQNIYTDVDTRLQLASKLKKMDPNAATSQTSYYGLKTPFKPVIIASILNETRFHKYLSPTFRGNMFSNIRSVDNLLYSFKEHSNDENNHGVLNMYMREIKYQIKLIDLEINFLNKKVNEDDVQDLFLKYQQEKWNFKEESEQ